MSQLLILFLLLALTSSVSTASSSEHVPPMHVVFGSIPCYGHWNPLRSVAKAIYTRGHHVTLLMEEDKMKWCTGVRDSFATTKLHDNNSSNSTAGGRDTTSSSPSFEYGSVGHPTFNCVPLPTSNTFKPDFFINMSKSDDIAGSFDHLFSEMFAFANVLQEAYSKSLYMLGDLTGSLKDKNGKPVANKERCDKAAFTRASLVGISPELASTLCQLPPVTIFLTDSGTFPTYTAAMQFGIPSMALFPLSVNLPSTPSAFLPMLGSGRPSLHFMTFWDRLATYTKRQLLGPVMKFLAIPQVFNPIRAEINTKLQSQTQQFPVMPAIPEYRGGMGEASMMNSIIFTPGIWGYDVAQPLCPNIIAIGSTAVGDDGGVEGPGVADRRVTEFGIQPVEGPISEVSAAALLARRELLEEQLAIFLDQAPACVNYGAVYVNFGTLSVLSDETFNRVLTALWHVPFCIVWKISETDRFERVKAMLHKSEMPAELTQYATSIITSNNPTQLRSKSDKESSEQQQHHQQQQPPAPDTGSNPRGRFYIGKFFASPDAILEHPNTKAFISHCGDTSVLESIAALVPVAGIPIFADQPDVCQRIEESGIGSYIGPKSSFDPQRLVTKLMEMGLNTHPIVAAEGEEDEMGSRFRYLSKLQQVRHMSTLLGGPARAAAVVEQHYLEGLLDAKSAFTKRQKPTSNPAISQGGSAPGAFFHVPSACLANVPPYSNPDAFGEAVGYPTPAEKASGPWFSVDTLTVGGNYDIQFVVFLAVGFWYIIAVQILKFICKRLLRCFFGGGRQRESTENQQKDTTISRTKVPVQPSAAKDRSTETTKSRSIETSSKPQLEHIRIRAAPMKESDN